MATWSRGLAGALACALSASLVSVPSAHADDDPPAVVVKRIETKLGNLESSVERLAREYENPIAELRSFSLARRLVDARVFYELGNYETAAVVLFDIIDSPAFRNNPDFYSASLILGMSLLQIRNYRAAHTYLSQAAQSPDTQLADDARYHLIDMALTSQNDRELRELLRQMGPTATDRTRYAVGKGLLRLEDHASALAALRGISPSSELFVLAQYYVGVVLTAQKQYEPALKLFTSLTKLEPKTPEQARARELSLVAAGRLLMDKGDIDRAVTMYQLVDRKSASYDVALYEMAWAYIKREQYDQALKTVDILLLVVEDEQLDVEGHVLRGRLSVFMDDYDEARESYDRIISRFAPIRNELERFIADPDNIGRYFAWLIERHGGHAELSSPLSEKTTAWVESTEGMARVVNVFDELSAEKKDVVETRQIAADLERIITSSNRVDLFPQLKDGWQKSVALTNQLVALSSEMLDHQYRLSRPKVGGETRAELEGLITWRRKLEERFRKIPMSYKAYQRREARVNESYLDLQRKSFLVEQTLEEVKRQLLAIEKLVNDQQFADAGDKMPDDKERDIRVSIDHEKDQLQQLFSELKGLKLEIAAEAERVGSGDVVSQDEAALQANLIATHKREGNSYDALSGKVGNTNLFGRYAAARERVWRQISRLRGVIGAIDKRVADKTLELQRIVSTEQARIEQYERELAQREQDGRQIAQAVGAELFDGAVDRMNSVVLEADVGLLDVAWAKKRRKTDAIRKIQSERADKLQLLQEEGQELLDEIEEEEGGEGGEK